MPFSEPRYATGEIAGNELTHNANPLRVIILDGDAFSSEWRGTDKVSPDGTVHAKISKTRKKARRFGALMEQCPVGLLAQIRADINAALDAGETFRVQLSDEVNTIDVQALPDFKVEKWLSHDEAGSFGGYAKAVTLRFVATGNGE